MMSDDRSPGKGLTSSVVERGDPWAACYRYGLLSGAAICFVLAIYRLGYSTFKGNVSDPTDVTSLGLLGGAAIGLLMLRVGPLVRLKISDHEAEFGNIVSNTANSVELLNKDILAAIEEVRQKFEELAGSRIHTPEDLKAVGGKLKEAGSASRKPPRRAPALSRPEDFSDDQWKGRFGGRSEVDGFRLTASFGRAKGDWVPVTLTLTTPSDRLTNGIAEFFLHQTFDRDRVKVPIVNGVAKMNLRVWGGFTVGVWIESVGIELELDLAELPTAPYIVREF